MSAQELLEFLPGLRDELCCDNSNCFPSRDFSGVRKVCYSSVDNIIFHILL